MYSNKIELTPWKRRYVTLMMEIIGRSLEAGSQVDHIMQAEVARMPDRLMFEMRVIGNGPALVMVKTEDGVLRYVGTSAPRKVDVAIKFKHLTHAFLVFSFQESTARSFANDRILLDGEISHALIVVRCLNRMESLILPKFVAVRALKRYPNLAMLEKLYGGGRIYSQVAKNYFWG